MRSVCDGEVRMRDRGRGSRKIKGTRHQIQETALVKNWKRDKTAFLVWKMSILV